MTEASVGSLLFRAGRQNAAPSPSADELLACAAACRAAGLSASAEMVTRVAFVRQGYSPQALAWRAGVAARAGLPLELAGSAAAPEPAGSTVEIALTEATRLARMLADRADADAAEYDAAALPSDDLSEFVQRLDAFLAEPDPAEPAVARSLLADLHAATGRAAGLDARSFATAPLPLLATAMALVALRDFVVANHELIYGATGSAAMLHAAARCDGSGLGPYLSNVERIATRSRDLFWLARTAVRDATGGAAEDDVHRLVFVLAQRLSAGLRDEVIDDLGDLAASAALARFLARAADRPDARIDVGTVMRLRDAGLDIGDVELARRCQALIVRLRPDQLHERAILGSIEATGGLVAAAEQSFLSCLTAGHDSDGMTRRLAALRSGDFAPYAVREGYGTPQDRRIARRGRRSARADGQQRARRPEAVEL